MKLKTSVVRSSVLRPPLSARAPLIRGSTSMGTSWAAWTAATLNGESVSSRMSQPRAIITMKNDIMESRETDQKAA